MGHRRCFSFAQKRLILLRAGYCCELCSVKLTIENFHCDHKIPYSRGGATAVYNGQALCASCNRKKSDSV